MSFCALLNDVLNNNILWILQPNFQPVVLSSGRVFKLSTPTSLSYNLILINDKFIHVQGRTCVFVHDSSLTMSLYHFWVRRSETFIGVNVWIWTFQYWDIIISTKCAFPEIQAEISFLLWWMMLQFFEFVWYDMEEKNRTGEPVTSRGRKYDYLKCNDILKLLTLM